MKVEDINKISSLVKKLEKLQREKNWMDNEKPESVTYDGCPISFYEAFGESQIDDKTANIINGAVSKFLIGEIAKTTNQLRELGVQVE
jgi:hypothetical protein